VRSIAKRCFHRCLAPAQEQFLVCIRRKFDRRDTRSFVRTITKWLFTTFTTRAPEIGFSRLYFDRIRGFLGNNGIIHDLLPYVKKPLNSGHINAVLQLSGNAVSFSKGYAEGFLENWSGQRGSNPRPRAWEARALPTELHPHYPAAIYRIRPTLKRYNN
jgi:hypothetical protein